MLFKVIIICVALGAIKAEPFRMEPQFEADDEDEVRDELLPKWFESTNHAQAEGTDIEIVEVEPTAEPEAEPEPETGEAPTTAKGPVTPDGVQLPLLDEYVAHGYDAAGYEAFIARRMNVDQNGNPLPSNEPVLIAGESKNEYGAIYMGHAADGTEVWDPPSPPPADASGIDTQPDGETKAQR